jgi:hypothetical protein
MLMGHLTIQSQSRADLMRADSIMTGRDTLNDRSVGGVEASYSKEQYN